jgi:hypothetical protein
MKHAVEAQFELNLAADRKYSCPLVLDPGPGEGQLSTLTMHLRKVHDCVMEFPREIFN